MTGNAKSLSERGSLTTAEYHEAAWEAYDRQAAPPDPAALSDDALHAFIRYEAPGLLLPSDAHEAVEAESTRRGLSADVIDELTAIGMLTVLNLGGVVIGWALLVP